MVTATDPEELIKEHLRVIQQYAFQVFIQKRGLDDVAYADQEWRMVELFAIWRSLRLTDKDLVCLIFGGLFSQTPKGEK